MRTCKVCKKVDSKAKFHGYLCRTCKSRQDESRPTRIKYLQDNRERRIEKLKLWQADHPEYSRDYKRLLYYNVSRDDFNRQAKKQGWVCAICECDIERHSHVDHDHTTGIFRGILCGSCNVGLGKFAHNADWLYRASVYMGRRIE